MNWLRWQALGDRRDSLFIKGFAQRISKGQHALKAIARIFGEGAEHDLLYRWRQAGNALAE